MHIYRKQTIKFPRPDTNTVQQRMLQSVALAASALIALSAPRPATAFAPSAQCVRAPAQRLYHDVAVSGHMGPRSPPAPGQCATSKKQPAATAGAAAASSEFVQHESTRYDESEFFDGFMTSVLDKVNEREEMEVSRAPAKRGGIDEVMDTLVTVAACTMAMQFFGVWMALGVWIARRADAVIDSTFSAASGAQALVVAFASGHPLDRKTRRKVLTASANCSKKKHRSADEALPNTFQPALVTTATAVPERPNPISMQSANIMDSLCEPTSIGPNEQELREAANQKARAEAWELTKDIAFLASYNTRRAAEFGAKKVIHAPRLLFSCICSM